MVDDPLVVAAGDWTALRHPARFEAIASVHIVADDTSWRSRVSGFLIDEGFEVFADSSGDTVIARAAQSDAAIVDLDLTARSGEGVCREWRDHSDAPLVAVAADPGERRVLAAFAAGADHVASTTISERQLVARLRAMLRRRPRRGRDGALDYPHLPIVLDDTSRVVLVHGVKVELTDGEYDLLRLLVQRPGRVVARRELLVAVRVEARGARLRTVDFYIRRLREKLESVDDRRRVVAVRGIGFRLDVDDAGPEFG